MSDGTAASIDELSERADLVVSGTVRSTFSLGRPDLSEDEYADEFVAIEIDVDAVIKGPDADTVVLGWDAINVDPAGERVATWIANGVPPPHNGDDLLLFLLAAEPDHAEVLGNVPTHQLLQLDGIAFLDGDGEITLTEPGSPLEEMESLEAVRQRIG